MLQNLDKLKETPKKPKQGGCMGLSLFFVIVGVGMLAFVYWLHTQQQAFARIAISTVGTVIEMQERTSKSSSGSRSTSYAPVVQFVTTREDVYTFTSVMSSNPPAYSVRDQVEVLYNPENPSEAVLARDNSIGTNPMMLIMSGLALSFIVIGGTVYVIQFRQRQRYI
jgi:hypothetical protein